MLAVDKYACEWSCGERKEYRHLTGLQDPVKLVLINVGMYECIHLDEHTMIFWTKLYSVKVRS